MDKRTVEYTSLQREEILDFIEMTFGESGEYDIHEIKSEYVHTDIALRTMDDEAKSFVTFGMGARSMAAPIPELEHAELVMVASQKLDSLGKRGMLVAGELTSLSKFPFREDTWFGAGHTINISKPFKEEFGFDAVVFFSPDLSLEMTDLGEVSFLVAVPIYEDEREWIMQNDSFEYLDRLYDAFGERMLMVDNKRGHFIPEDTE